MEKLFKFSSNKIDDLGLGLIYGGAQDTINVHHEEGVSSAGPDVTGDLGNCTDDKTTETDDDGNTIETCEQWTCEN